MARIIITAGEPAGIGPEICLQAIASGVDADIAIAGDPSQLRALRSQLDLDLEISTRSTETLFRTSSTSNKTRQVAVLPLSYPSAIVAGKPDPTNSPTQIAGLQAAAELALTGQCDAIVTAPLQKSTIIEAGISFSGHTEFLAEICDAPLPVMMLASASLRVALLTTHLPLRAVPDAVTAPRIETTLTIVHEALQTRFGIVEPKIGVCGLNPHAGENGHLGAEDDEIIAPVIQTLKQRGYRLAGPLPADTAFAGEHVGRYDAILAMYHDQGLPVIKHTGFGSTVNITLGLPIVRTSVDHGTALDLAGTGRADSSSLSAAIAEAQRMCEQRLTTT